MYCMICSCRFTIRAIDTFISSSIMSWMLSDGDHGQGGGDRKFGIGVGREGDRVAQARGGPSEAAQGIPDEFVRVQLCDRNRIQFRASFGLTYCCSSVSSSFETLTYRHQAGKVVDRDPRKDLYKVYNTVTPSSSSLPFCVVGWCVVHRYERALAACDNALEHIKVAPSMFLQRIVRGDYLALYPSLVQSWVAPGVFR